MFSKGGFFAGEAITGYHQFGYLTLQGLASRFQCSASLLQRFHLVFKFLLGDQQCRFLSSQLFFLASDSGQFLTEASFLFSKGGFFAGELCTQLL